MNHKQYRQFWADQLRKNGRVCEETIEEFLETHVPGNKPTKPCPPDLFARYSFNQELDDYTGMAKSLNTLMQNIDEERRIQFAVTKDAKLEPISESEYTFWPDVAGTYPGNAVPSTWTWYHCIIDIEIESRTGVDTLDSRTALARVAYNGRSILAASGACFCFVITVCAEYARIFRVDHAGAIISPRFDIKSNPESIFEFFWRLVHPPTINLPVDGISTIVLQPKLLGLDTTVTAATEAEKEWLKATLKEYHSYFLDGDQHSGPDKAERHAKYAKKILAKRGTKLEWCFTIGMPLWQTAGLFSRATRVMRVLFKEEPNRFYALKDTWRHVYRRSEVDFYKRVSEKYGEENYPPGLAKVAGAIDFGECLDRHAGYLTSSVIIADGDTPRSLRPQSPLTDSSEECSITLSSEGSERMDEDSDWSEKGSRLLQKIEAEFARQADKGDELVGQPETTQPRDLNRTLTRTTLFPVGRDLLEFRSTKQLVKAIRDAIQGHQKLKECGILHRDISASNILLVDGEAYNGFLHDLDYSTLLKGSKPKLIRNLKEKTGTYEFMAIGVLKGKAHDEKHDLESFFWLLLWVVYRHVRHRGITDGLFDQREYEVAAMIKLGYLSHCRTPIVKGNGPLTWLLHQLGVWLQSKRRTRVTHESFLGAFDKALELDTWPETNDGPRPYVPVNLYERQLMENRSIYIGDN